MVVPEAHSMAHEEDWGGALRVEVKSGARATNPIWARYLVMERQSESWRTPGDNRPFVGVLYPPDGAPLAIMRLAELMALTKLEDTHD